MPRTAEKKLRKSVSPSRQARKSFKVKKSVKSEPAISSWMSSYSSLLLGIVVVIVGALFVVSSIRQQNHQQTSSIATGPTPTASVSPTPVSTLRENGQTYYVVKTDDSLWSIAEMQYHDGYKWTDIAKANNLNNPGTIYKGDKLLLPDEPLQTSPLGQLENKENNQIQPQSITANSYTVQKDDTLWSIAVRAYADGYKWTDIAKANNLSNPDMIFSGNVLTIPR